MKIKLNQLMEDENGKLIQPVNKPPLCLRDVIVSSLLTPSQNENEKDKATKYEVFKLL